MTFKEWFSEWLKNFSGFRNNEIFDGHDFQNEMNMAWKAGFAEAQREKAIDDAIEDLKRGVS